jgi:hypothetical protein
MDTDMVMRNWKTNRLLYIEDKAYLQEPTRGQNETVKLTYQIMHYSPYWAGYFLLQHENTGSMTGYNWLSIYDTDHWKPIVKKDGNRNLSGEEIQKYFRYLLLQQPKI